MRVCKTCGANECDKIFRKIGRSCVECFNVRARELHTLNKASRNKKAKEWRDNNHEKISNNRNEWLKLNPQKKRESQRKWRLSKPENQMFTNAKNRSKSKNIPFDLELSDIFIPKTCPVLGLELKVSLTGKLQDESPSLDRIIPKLGYIKGNVRVISWRANKLKNDATLEELEKITLDLRRINNSISL